MDLPTTDTPAPRWFVGCAVLVIATPLAIIWLAAVLWLARWLFP